MDKVEELLARGVEKVYPSKEALGDEAKKRKLTVYQGFDPTSSELHIGHMVGLRKLKQWQDLGHRVIFLVGDFTATIGDPTGKDNARVPLTHEEVMKNARTYKEQASKILNFEGENAVEMKFNSEWLGKISAAELLKLAQNVTHGQLIERDMFQNRIKNEKDVYLSELLYPIMQAYDSVMMDVDVEVGGSDQTFNMLMGRKLMRNLKQKEKFVMTTPLLTDASGKKIGKTEGNVIGLSDKPLDLFAKIMALGDDIIVKGFEYLTDVPMEEVQQIGEDLRLGKNPVSYKKMLAFEITKQLNGHDEAHKAQEDFEKNVQGKEKSTDVQNVVSENSGTPLSQIAINNGLVSSNSEWKRLIGQGGIKINSEQLKSPSEVLVSEIVLQRGRKSVRVKLN
ncbi:MAG TPA: tyrosine--tRNA ligase [Patescibacteria group bacterium]|nr:tyrosine--tRNA ligase [Patescibacteria group bacterium]